MQFIYVPLGLKYMKPYSLLFSAPLSVMGLTVDHHLFQTEISLIMIDGGPS